MALRSPSIPRVVVVLLVTAAGAVGGCVVGAGRRGPLTDSEPAPPSPAETAGPAPSGSARVWEPGAWHHDGARDVWVPGQWVEPGTPLEPRP